MSKKTRVLIVMDGMKVGGVENALISVLNNMEYDLFEVELLLLHNDTEMLEYVNEQVMVKILNAQQKVQLSLSFVFYYSLCRICKMLGFRKNTEVIRRKLQHSSLRQRAKAILEKQFDIVIGYKQGETEDFVANCIEAKKKIVFYHHGSLIDEKLHEQTYSKVNIVVSISPGVQTMLAERYPQFSGKIRMIPNYVDCQSIYEKSQKYSIERPLDKLVLCTVGRLVSDKRYDLVVETAVKIRDEYGKNFVWYCIGDGEKRIEIEKLITMYGLEEQVLLMGEIRNPMPYIQSSDIYVQTSDAESYGLAMQEAMVLKKPVVSTKTIGGELLVKHKQNGYLVEADEQSIYQGICWIMQGHLHMPDNTHEYERIDMNIKEKWMELLGKSV